MAERGPALLVHHLAVRFGSRPALVGVDLEVPSGQFVALVGPNGSGKTTLIRAALGFQPPSEGYVELFGERVDRMPPLERARRVAWVPQEEPARDNVPLIEYVLYGRYAHRGMLEGDSPEDRTLAMRILREVGLEDRAADGILSISGGERQRAILARALAQETDLLLLDEPTSHLDIGHQLDILGRVRELARARRVTVLAALHDLNLAARFADRVAVLSRGRLVADGTPDSVLSEALLLRVWGVSAQLRRDPRTGAPFLIPYALPPPRPAPAGRGEAGPVHVVGGGGAASACLRLLNEAGFTVTTGVLHLFDSDTETAEALGLPIAREVPFAPLGPESRQRNEELLAHAAAIVVAPFVVGPSNLANLTDVRPHVVRAPTYLLARPPIAERDFCGGAATATYAELRRAGAVELLDLDELVAALRRDLPASAPAT